jgi:hypothetical protein
LAEDLAGRRAPNRAIAVLAASDLDTRAEIGISPYGAFGQARHRLRPISRGVVSQPLILFVVDGRR